MHNIEKKCLYCGRFFTAKANTIKKHCSIECVIKKNKLKKQKEGTNENHNNHNTDNLRTIPKI